MNKKQLIGVIAKEAGLTKTGAERALNALTGNITESLKKGEAVQFVGFGTFSVSKRSARTGRNPQTGQAMKIPAKKVVKFKAGKTLGDTLK